MNGSSRVGVERRRPPGRGELGQATAELVLALPAVLVMFLLSLQVAVVGRDQVLVVNAARAGARSAAVSSSWSRARQAVESSGPLRSDRLQMSWSRDPRAGGVVRVTVKYRAPTELPLVGPLVPDVTLASTVSMRVER